MISVEIVQGDIEHRLPVAEFVDRVVDRLANIPLTLTREQQRKRMRLAMDQVIQEIRDNA